MAISISREQVHQILLPEIGPAMANSTVALHVTDMLRQYRRGDDLLQLRENLRKSLFQDLYAVLGARMHVVLQNGEDHRIRMEALPKLADALLGALFTSLGTSDMPKDTLMRFAMTSGSLCAMRTLLDAYSLSEREQALLQRILRESEAFE